MTLPPQRRAWGTNIDVGGYQIADQLPRRLHHHALVGFHHVLNPRLSRRPAAEVGFVEPMYALAVKNLPEGKEWLYEVKFDGYRCLAGKRNDGVTLWSRRGNLFTAQFPHIACACERLPADTLLDGEIVAVDESGRISFNLIQHHRSQAQALLFYAFDVLMPGQEPIERTA